MSAPQARSTRSSRSTCCSLLRVMLPAKSIERRKHLLTISVAKPRYNAEAVLKTYDLFIYGDTHYTNNSFCVNVLNIARHPSLGCELRS